MTGQKTLFGESEISSVDASVDGSLRLPVMLPLPLKGVLDYALNDGTDCPAVGSFVEVPLSGRLVIGVVWHKPDEGGKVIAYRKLKPISRILDVPPMSMDLIKFISWVAAYTLTHRGVVMKMCMTAPGIFSKVPTKLHVAKTDEEPARMTPARLAVLDVLADGSPRPVSEVASEAGVSDAVVRTLLKQGVLAGVELSVDAPYDVPHIDTEGPVLSEEQDGAVGEIVGAISKGGYSPFLLDGVTGSGKTEVYFEGMIEALKCEGAQVAVLLPEIALTSQWLSRFEDRFGVAPVVWHSDVGQAERRRAWHAVAKGQARVVVGARSALFLPFKNLKFIVVDEEHDQSFKQEEGVLYHARDMAVLRAYYAECPIVLASATPSMESMVNGQAEKYTHLKLRERHGGAQLPTMHAVDMRINPPASGEWISPALAVQMDKTLGRGEQVILFLNRRGYAPLTLCRTCGHRLECPNCTAWLVEHRYKRNVQCHHCGYDAPIPDVCPSCENEDSMVACGPGVERLTEEVIKRFPSARVAMMTSDTMTSPDKTAAMVAQISSGDVDIIIGTQVVTKGYHFPKITLVGVVDADLGLRGGDMRAGERTYQQLMQVAGRAGREDLPGQVYLQSYEPEHPVVKALLSGNGEAFMEAEMDVRKRFSMPPFGKLVALIITGNDLQAVATAGRKLAATAPRGDGMEVLGPAPAPLARIKSQHRYRMLFHARKDVPVQSVVRDWLARAGHTKDAKIKVDVDPYSFT